MAVTSVLPMANCSHIRTHAFEVTSGSRLSNACSQRSWHSAISDRFTDPVAAGNAAARAAFEFVRDEREALDKEAQDEMAQAVKAYTDA